MLMLVAEYYNYEKPNWKIYDLTIKNKNLIPFLRFFLAKKERKAHIEGRLRGETCNFILCWFKHSTV